MKDLQSTDDVLKDGIRNLAGFYGTKRITGTNPVVVNCLGYYARTETVIAAITNDTHDVGLVSGYAGLTVLAGQQVFFGMVAKSITLTSGDGEAFRSEPITLPANPKLGRAITSTNGATITLDFDQTMPNPAALVASFILSVNGTPVTVSSVALASDTSNYTLTPAVPIIATDVVTLTLATKILKTAAGAYFLGCTDFKVTNYRA